MAFYFLIFITFWTYGNYNFYNKHNKNYSGSSSTSCLLIPPGKWLSQNGSFIGIKNKSLEKLNRIIKPKIASTNANQKFMETNNTATVKQIPIANEFVPKVLIHQDNEIKTIIGVPMISINLFHCLFTLNKLFISVSPFFQKQQAQNCGTLLFNTIGCLPVSIKTN